MAKRGKRYYRTINFKRIFITIIILSLIVAGTVLGLALTTRRAGTLALDGTSFYAVAVGDFDTLNAANASATSLRRMGGAGFVVADGDSFRVVVAVYNRQSEANTVAARLAVQESLDTIILEWATSPVSFATTNRELAKEFSEFFTHPIDVFNSLLRHSQNLEEGTITESHASTILNSIRTNLNQKATRLSNFSTDFGDYVPPLQDFYREFSSLISDTLRLQFGDTLAVNIRYLTASVVYDWHRVTA